MEKIPAVIGIDPGLDGGVTVMNIDQLPGMYRVVKMPTAGKDKREIDVYSLCNTVREWLKDYDIRLCVIEKAAAMKKQGVSSMFTFGKGYGMVIGALTAMSLPLTYVTPQAWKKEVLSGTKKDKSAAINYVLSRHPGISLIPEGCRVHHDGMADSVCIATYAARSLQRWDEEERLSQ